MTKTKSQKQRSRAIRAKGMQNSNRNFSILTKSKSNGRKRNGRNRGLLSDLGNMFLPGIGGAIGQLGDNFVGGLLGGKGAPVAYSGQAKSTQVHTSTEHGVEELAVISIPANTPAGTILLQALISPTSIGTRLPQFAKLWSNSKIRKFVVNVTSSNPTDNAGNYTLAIDPDPVQSYPSDPNLPGRLFALSTASRANVWASTSVAMKPNNLLVFNKFNTAGASDAELRQFAVGQVLLATTTDIPQDCNLVVSVEWDVEFQRPDTQFDTVGGGGQDYTLNLVSKNAVASTTTVLFFNQEGIIAPKPPIGDIFSFVGNQPVLRLRNPGGITTTHNIIAVEQETTVTLAVELSAPVVVGESYFVVDQTPSPYKFSGGASFASVGLARISSALLASPAGRGLVTAHRQWRDAVEVKRIERLRRTHMEAAEAKFAIQSAIKELEALKVADAGVKEFLGLKTNTSTVPVGASKTQGHEEV